MVIAGLVAWAIFLAILWGMCAAAGRADEKAGWK